MLAGVLAQGGSVSFGEFFLIVLGLLAVLVIAGILVARRTGAQDALRHDSAIGEFEPGVVGNLQARMTQAANGHEDARRWLDSFLEDAVADAVALRHRLPKADAAERLRGQGFDDLPKTVQSLLEGQSYRRRWRLRRRSGVRPRVPTTFSLRRILLPVHISAHELFLQDVEQILLALERYAKGDSI